MPIPATAKWPKPKSEDEFEDICVDFLRLRWKDPNATRHGRRGQRQDGVDVIGHPERFKGRTAGAQCKNTDALQQSDVVAEAKKAEGFKGGLVEFLVITSGDRDADLQAKVREHFKASPASFSVDIVFWDDVVAELALDESLVAKHWKGFGELLQVHLPIDAQVPQSVEPVYDRVKKAARSGNVQIIERMGMRPDADGVVAYRAYHVAQWVENGAQQPDVELSSSQRQELLSLDVAERNLEVEELEDVAMQRQASLVYAGVDVRDLK